MEHEWLGYAQSKGRRHDSNDAAKGYFVNNGYLKLVWPLRIKFPTTGRPECYYNVEHLLFSITAVFIHDSQVVIRLRVSNQADPYTYEVHMDI